MSQNPCPSCQNHRWQVWNQKRRVDTEELRRVMIPCAACNPDGELEPPVLPAHKVKRHNEEASHGL